MNNLKFIFLSIVLLYSSITFSQNVGINNNSPSEELDVTGNINLTGELKVNGTAGQNGQILQANGNGTMQWINKSAYSNFMVFDETTTWSVPAGVSEITIEVWGGGGGGWIGGGGGGGSYVKASLILLGSALTITIGDGGIGGSSSPNGKNSSVQSGLEIATAFGGIGGSGQNAGHPSALGMASANWFNVISFQGTAGKQLEREFSQGGTTLYIKEKGGNGGDSFGHLNSGGGGGTSLSEYQGSSFVQRTQPTRGNMPGAGGGGRTTITTNADGTKGRVIIYWN